MPTFGAWEHTVLAHAYDEVDYVSMHAYYEEHDGDHASFLACAVDMDRFIESVVATVDAVGAARKSRKKIDVSFDEWNVWYQKRDAADSPAQVGRAGWVEHPRLIEDVYTVTDAVVVGTFLNSLLRHGDRVKIANQAQLVNVIAPILTEPGGAGLAAVDLLAVRPDRRRSPGARSSGCTSTPTGRRRRSTATWTSSTSAARTTRRRRRSPCSSRTGGPRARPTSRSTCAAWPPTGVLGAEVLTRPRRGRPARREPRRRRAGPAAAAGGVTVGRPASDVVRLRLPRSSWAAVQLSVESV